MSELAAMAKATAMAMATAMAGSPLHHALKFRMSYLVTRLATVIALT